MKRMFYLNGKEKVQIVELKIMWSVATVLLYHLSDGLWSIFF